MEGIWNWSSDGEKGKKGVDVRTDWGSRRWWRHYCRSYNSPRRWRVFGNNHWKRTTPYSARWKGRSRVLLPGSLRNRLRRRRRPTRPLTAAPRPPRCSWPRTTPPATACRRRQSHIEGEGERSDTERKVLSWAYYCRNEQWIQLKWIWVWYLVGFDVTGSNVNRCNLHLLKKSIC